MKSWVFRTAWCGLFFSAFAVGDDLEELKGIRDLVRDKYPGLVRNIVEAEISERLGNAVLEREYIVNSLIERSVKEDRSLSMTLEVLNRTKSVPKLMDRLFLREAVLMVSKVQKMVLEDLRVLGSSWREFCTPESLESVALPMQPKLFMGALPADYRVPEQKIGVSVSTSEGVVTGSLAEWGPRGALMIAGSAVATQVGVALGMSSAKAAAAVAGPVGWVALGVFVLMDTIMNIFNTGRAVEMHRLGQEIVDLQNATIDLQSQDVLETAKKSCAALTSMNGVRTHEGYLESMTTKVQMSVLRAEGEAKIQEELYDVDRTAWLANQTSNLKRQFNVQQFEKSSQHGNEMRTQIENGVLKLLGSNSNTVDSLKNAPLQDMAKFWDRWTASGFRKSGLFSGRVSVVPVIEQELEAVFKDRVGAFLK